MATTADPNFDNINLHSEDETPLSSSGSHNRQHSPSSREQGKRKGRCCNSPVFKFNWREAIKYEHLTLDNPDRTKIRQIIFQFCPESRSKEDGKNPRRCWYYIELVAYIVAYMSAILALVIWRAESSPRRPMLNYLLFFSSFLGMMPSAKGIGSLTDQISLYLGPGLAALLTATFGNVVELMVAFVALITQKSNGITLVQASLVGSILSNLLLVLGTALLAAGWHRHVVSLSDNHDRIGELESEGAHGSHPRPEATNPETGPSFERSHPRQDKGKSEIELKSRESGPPMQEEKKSETESIVKTRKGGEGLGSQTGAGTLALCLGSILIPTIFARGTDASEADVLQLSRITSFILLVSYIAYLYFTSFTHAEYLESKADDDPGKEKPDVQVWIAILALALHTALLAVLSLPLTDGLNGITDGGKVKEVFFSLVALPWVGNLAEHWTAVQSGWRSKMVQALGVAIGSGIQICLFVIPACVLFAWALKVPLSLNFDPFQVVALFVAIFLVNALISDDESNWFEGFILVLVYIIIAVGAWYDPFTASSSSTSPPSGGAGKMGMGSTAIPLGPDTAGALLANLTKGVTA